MKRRRLMESASSPSTTAQGVTEEVQEEYYQAYHGTKDRQEAYELYTDTTNMAIPKVKIFWSLLQKDKSLEMEILAEIWKVKGFRLHDWTKEEAQEYFREVIMSMDEEKMLWVQRERA
eukprot:4745448-Amphidinium_carterae.1